MHIVVALNFWGNAVANKGFWIFYRIYNCKRARIVPVSKLKLFRHIFGALHIRLSLGGSLRANFSTKAKTVILTLQPTILVLSSLCMPIGTPNPLWDLPKLK